MHHTKIISEFRDLLVWLKKYLSKMHMKLNIMLYYTNVKVLLLVS